MFSSGDIVEVVGYNQEYNGLLCEVVKNHPQFPSVVFIKPLQGTTWPNKTNRALPCNVRYLTALPELMKTSFIERLLEE